MACGAMRMRVRKNKMREKKACAIVGRTVNERTEVGQERAVNMIEVTDAPTVHVAVLLRGSECRPRLRARRRTYGVVTRRGTDGNKPRA